MKHRSKYIIIAIDGPAASGKGSIARELAKHFDLGYLDTGEMYRKLATTLITNDNISRNTIENALIQARNLNVKGEEIAKQASCLALNPKIRSILTTMQREFAHSQKNGAVLDGRDISSVVLPNAHHKIFITAKTFIRARRRFIEMRQSSIKKSKPMYKQVLFKLIQRDVRDSCRSNAPMVHVKKSFYIDNSHIDFSQTLHEIIKRIKSSL